MIKLPKPHLICGTFLPISGFEGSEYGYTSEQMREMRRDALDEAIRIAREREVEGNDAQWIAGRITTLKDET
jgi:hypothetical protein